MQARYEDGVSDPGGSHGWKHQREYRTAVADYLVAGARATQYHLRIYIYAAATKTTHSRSAEFHF